MKRILITTACLLLSLAASSQEKEPFQRSWSVEIGTGFYPFYMTSFYVPSRDLETELADQGQEIYNTSQDFVSSVSIAGVYRFGPHSEVTATGQLHWRNYQVRQYPVFGTDPNGKNRYDLNQEAEYVSDGIVLVPALTLRYRYLYNPGQSVTVYTGFGIGANYGSTFMVIPEITPLGLHFGESHFYVFAELTIGNVATLAHGGLGWKF